MSTLGDDDVAIDLEGVQGPAAIGRVVDTGTRATALAGQRVLVGPVDPCGECEVCRRGGGAVCPLARRRTAWPARIIAAARWVVPLVDGLDLPSPAGAAVAGDIALAYTLYARTGAAPREPIVVVGAHPITRFLVEILRAKGLTFAVVVDPAHTAWTEWLARGETPMVHATEPDAARVALTALFASVGLGGKPHRVIATTDGAVLLGAALAGPRATLTVLATPDAPIVTLPGDLVTREVLVIGVAGVHPDLVVEVAAMCVKGEIDLAGGTSPDAVLGARVSPP